MDHASRHKGRGALLLVCCALWTQTAAAAEPRRVLVMDLGAKGVEAQLAAQATSLTADALSGRADITVSTLEDVRAAVGHDKLQAMMGCAGGNPCTSELAGVAKADDLLTGVLGKLGARYTVTLNLTDVRTSSVKNSASLDFTALKELPDVLRRAGEQLFGAAAAGPRFSVEGKKASFAVLDLGAKGVPPDAAANLTQVLSAELRKVDKASVISREDIQAMLQLEEMKSKAGCDDTSCLAEIGGALGVEHLVTGSVGKLGDIHVVSLSLLSVKTATVVQRVTETFNGPEDQLLRAVRHAGRQLVGVKDPPPGAVAVSASEPSATVLIDGQGRGAVPMKPVNLLAAGQHVVKVEKKGFFEWSGDVYVDPTETTALYVELKPRPLAWYQRWWVWTIMAGTGVAVVVVSAAVLGVATVGSVALVNYLRTPAPATGSGTATAR